MHTIVVAVLIAANAAPEAPLPECSIEATWNACLADTGNKVEMLACHRPALRAARRVLVEELDALHRDNVVNRPALDAAIAAAHREWWRAMDADCGAVSHEWDGGSMRDAVVSSCYVEQTLARIRWLRHWHDQSDAACPQTQDVDAPPD